MGAEVDAIRLDGLARDRGGRRHREHVRKCVVGFLEPDAQRVAIDDLKPGERRLVVELAAFLRRRLQLVAADKLAFEDPRPR